MLHTRATKNARARRERQNAGIIPKQAIKDYGMTNLNKMEQNAAATKRWRTRLKRAMTMLDKLEKQRKRLERAVDLAIAPKGATKPQARPPKAPSLAETIMRQIAEPQPAPSPAPPADLAIPSFLRREPDPVAEQLKAEQAETKRLKARGRIATMKAKQSGETRKMPLTGKAALAAIRG
jgi:hypothetical protein